jgi:hypothetical protein
LVRFAVVACQVGTLLSTNTGAVANLELGDFRTNLDNLANDLVSYAERQRNVLSPSAGDRVDIGSANTARINGDIDIVILELLERQLKFISSRTHQQCDRFVLLCE